MVNAFRGPISGGTVLVLSGEDLLNHVAAVRVYDSSPASDGEDADYVGEFTIASVDAVATIESASGSTLAMSVEASPDSAVLTTGTFDLSTDTFTASGS